MGDVAGTSGSENVPSDIVRSDIVAGSDSVCSDSGVAQPVGHRVCGEVAGTSGSAAGMVSAAMLLHAIERFNGLPLSGMQQELSRVSVCAEQRIA